MSAPDNAAFHARELVCRHTGAALQFPARLGGRFGISSEGVVYSADAHSLDYDADYFLTEYSKQYGRSYEDDAPALRALSRRRLDAIQSIRRSRGSLFEIGSALGFFLDEARTRGYNVRGLEISAFACNYARSTLGLDVIQQSFLTMSTSVQYDVVAAFYVIEHFEDQRAVFEKVSALLRPGGVFAFALPSTNGPMYAHQPQEWVRTHPADHFADYSPDSLRRLLPRYGMRLVRARPSSYHPNRARGLWRLAGPLYKTFADAFTFGDTMEGVAAKE